MARKSLHISIGFYWGFLCLILVFAPLARAENTVKMAGGDGVWPDSVEIDVADLPHFSETIETIDPNFKEEGITSYTGLVPQSGALLFLKQILVDLAVD